MPNALIFFCVCVIIHIGSDEKQIYISTGLGGKGEKLRFYVLILAKIEVGDKLISINGHDFHDILEYRYLTAEYEVTLEILKKDGTTEVITVENDYDDIGIEFEEGLIDEAQSCRNKCIFCFIDQLPKGMRETVYFKDDDTRLSFLQETM